MSDLSEEQRKAIAELFHHTENFIVRKTTFCPHCDEHVTDCEQVGRCVYARPCGCRVYQGRVHENWKQS